MFKNKNYDVIYCIHFYLFNVLNPTLYIKENAKFVYNYVVEKTTGEGVGRQLPLP